MCRNGLQGYRAAGIAVHMHLTVAQRPAKELDIIKYSFERVGIPGCRVENIIPNAYAVRTRTDRNAWCGNVIGGLQYSVNVCFIACVIVCGNNPVPSVPDNAWGIIICRPA